jgi:hypothetical protein
MKTTEQILEFLVEQIGHIYFRPLMYGGSAESVDLLLSHHQHLWALIVEHEKEFSNLIVKCHDIVDGF